jgi:hypothetical protein
MRGEFARTIGIVFLSICRGRIENVAGSKTTPELCEIDKGGFHLCTRCGLQRCSVTDPSYQNVALQGMFPF